MAGKLDAQGEIQARLAALTEGQRECLKMVGQLQTSKMIAQRLGLSSHAVDARIRAALRTLDVATRAEAAKLVMDYEPQAYQPLIYQSPELSAQPERPIDALPLGGLRPFGGEVQNALGEGQAALFPPELATAPQSRWSFWEGFSAEQDLPLKGRIAVVVGVALAGVVLVALLVNLAEGLSRLA